MKKYLLILLVFISCFVGNGLTIKEKIQQDLSKMGIKQEIIDETIFWDKIYAMDDSDLPLDIDEIISIFERIYEKDNKNYVAARKIMQFKQQSISYRVKKDYEEKIKNTKSKEDKKYYEEEQIQLKEELEIYKKYYDIFMKYNPYDYEKLLISNEYYTTIRDFEKAKEIEKIIRQKYKNTIIEKKIPVGELRNGIEYKYYNLGKLVEKKVNEELQFIERDKTKEKYRITEEEVYNLQLEYYMIKIWTYLYSSEREKGIEIAINELDNIKANESAKEYNFRLENGIIHWLLIVGGGQPKYFDKFANMKMNKRIEKMYDWVQEEENKMRNKYE